MFVVFLRPFVHLDTLPRRHIGELPSERKERQRSTMKAYKKFVSLTPNADQSFATYLMEALMKFASKSRSLPSSMDAGS